MTGNQGFGRLSQLREKEAQDKQDKAAVPNVPALEPVALPDLEMPELPAPAPQQQEATRLLSAQVPQGKKFEFDKHVLEAKQYYPDLEMREGVIALLDLLGDERVRRLWLLEIGKGKKAGG
ncbi:hypothetical protein ACFFLM_05320 [Deinococcus oregonensis]|uniref:Uncharacterized protein n=1 Tax=Deinococcus oregonensis TaxID=1805970 RepID=A0ABV6AV68_9DEIO